MRTFISIKWNPEPSFFPLLTEISKELANESIKWVDERKIHLTLKFLGETSNSEAEEVKKILTDVAPRSLPVNFQPTGLGYFKSRGMPRVLFLNIHHDVSLQLMAAELDEKLYTIGFEKETRPFNPHLTLARIKFLKNKKHFYQVIEKYQDISFQLVAVKQIIFYQSYLNPEGPVYKELANYPLADTP